jgi:hypothetical protein
MGKRTFHTSVNLLVEAGLYQRLRMIAELKKISMSKIIRDGIHLRLAQFDKEDNAIIGGQ